MVGSEAVIQGMGGGLGSEQNPYPTWVGGGMCVVWVAGGKMMGRRYRQLYYAWVEIETMNNCSPSRLQIICWGLLFAYPITERSRSKLIGKCDLMVIRLMKFIHSWQSPCWVEMPNVALIESTVGASAPGNDATSARG